MQKMIPTLTLAIIFSLAFVSFASAEEPENEGLEEVVKPIQMLYDAINENKPAKLRTRKKIDDGFQVVFIANGKRYTVETSPEIVHIYVRPDNGNKRRSLRSEIIYSVKTGLCISAIRSKGVDVPDKEYVPDHVLREYYEQRGGQDEFIYPQMNQREAQEFFYRHIDRTLRIFRLTFTVK